MTIRVDCNTPEEEEQEIQELEDDLEGLDF